MLRLRVLTITAWQNLCRPFTRTCLHLCWLAFTLLGIKSAPKWMHFCLPLATQRKWTEEDRMLFVLHVPGLHLSVIFWPPWSVFFFCAICEHLQVSLDTQSMLAQPAILRHRLTSFHQSIDRLQQAQIIYYDMLAVFFTWLHASTLY